MRNEVVEIVKILILKCRAESLLLLLFQDFDHSKALGAEIGAMCFDSVFDTDPRTFC